MDKDKLRDQLAMNGVPNRLITDVYAALVAGDEARIDPEATREDPERYHVLANEIQDGLIAENKRLKNAPKSWPRTYEEEHEFYLEFQSADDLGKHTLYTSWIDNNMPTFLVNFQKREPDALRADLETAVSILKALTDENNDKNDIYGVIIRADRWLMGRGQPCD